MRTNLVLGSGLIAGAIGGVSPQECASILAQSNAQGFGVAYRYVKTVSLDAKHEFLIFDMTVENLAAGITKQDTKVCQVFYDKNSTCPKSKKWFVVVVNEGGEWHVDQIGAAYNA